MSGVPLLVAVALASAQLTGCSVDNIAGSAPRAPVRIDVHFIGDAPLAIEVMDAVSLAIARWHQVVKGGAAQSELPLQRAVCGDDQIRTNIPTGTLVLFVDILPMDGPGSAVARSAPCALDSRTLLPVAARLELDSADAPLAARADILEMIVRHEVAHALGFGTLWREHRILTGSPTTQLTFTGSRGRAAFLASGGSSFSGTPVPVETHGGPGTAGNHWPASIFGGELMIAGPSAFRPMPLSIVTIASLEDLGYTVDRTAADAFTVVAASHPFFDSPTWDLSNDALSGPVYLIQDSGGDEPSRAGFDAAASSPQPMAQHASTRSRPRPR